LQQNAYMASIKGEDYKMLYAGEGELKGTWQGNDVGSAELQD
jgi:hypothetical protein